MVLARPGLWEAFNEGAGRNADRLLARGAGVAPSRPRALAPVRLFLTVRLSECAAPAARGRRCDVRPGGPRRTPGSPGALGARWAGLGRLLSAVISRAAWLGSRPARRAPRRVTPRPTPAGRAGPSRAEQRWYGASLASMPIPRHTPDTLHSTCPTAAWICFVRLALTGQPLRLGLRGLRAAGCGLLAVADKYSLDMPQSAEG